MTAMLRRATACLAILLGSVGAAQQTPPAAAGVTSGELIVEPATLINLGFEWLIEGDTNRNAKVDVSYRKVGETAWKIGMPLLRLQGERVTQPNVFNLVSPNMFAGSILDLEPDTAYEARFVLTDPDGVNGNATSAGRTATVRTRPEPRPAAGGKVYHVYPVGHTGTKIEPAFTGIMCAYNYYCGAGDTAPGGRPRVKPGDTILVHAGTYAYRYELYANQTTINATTTFEGTYYLTADGTPARPIVIKAAGDGEVIIDGRNNFNLFNVKAADYNYFEGITFRNTDIAIWAGTQFIAGSKGLTVKRCRFEQVGMGVFSNYSGSSNFYIADSVFLGRNDARHLIGWNGAFWEQFNGVDGQTFPPVMASYTAIRLYGPGHVVAYNHVADFHDGIDTEMYGMPDGSHAHDGPSYPPLEYWDRRPVAIDIYNNYITNAHDNSIEMDGSMHNIRLMRNVLINSASHPMSTQPSVGGPIYWIRNIVYHAPGGSTRMTAGSPGVLFYHNTVTTETAAGSSANSHWRNNLMLGQGVAPAIFSVNTSTSYSSSDYNGFRPNPGAEGFRWNVGPPPAPGATATPGFGTLADYVRATRQDQNSITLDYDVFVNVPKLDRDPKTVQRLYDFKDFDFRLKPGSAAVDRGVALPNINDGFTGKAPDLGALEAGQPLPTYGPRASTLVAQDVDELVVAHNSLQFYSAFWPNLHNLLWAEAWARRPASAAEPSPAGKLLEPLTGALTPEERAAWDEAVSYYDREVADLSLLFEMGPIRKAMIAGTGALPTTGLEPEHRRVLMAVAPVYRKYWWPSHGRTNRAWIAETVSRLTALSPGVPDRLVKLYGTPWFARPVRVDVVRIGSREGAYTSIDPAPAHITTTSGSPTNQGWAAAELLFHEASHALVQPMIQAFSAELRVQGKNSAAGPLGARNIDLWHPALFYLTGEVVRQVLAARDVVYVPYLYETGILDRAWPRFRAPLETHWKPYVNGEASRDEAIKNVVASIE